MIEYAESIYEGFNCLQIKNRRISFWITLDVGPRVIGMEMDGGENLMVVLPDAKIPVNGAADYTLRGGHRLWYAPEKPETTYIADDQPVEWARIKNGLEVVQEIDLATGIQKSWKLILDEEEAEITIDHQLLNNGSDPFRLAPWAVTMLRPGGVGIIPLQRENSDPHGLWPNRQLAIWPYTDLNSPSLVLGNEAVFVYADLEDGALKIGAPNPRGWIAYSIDGYLYVKKAAYDQNAEYLDRRASSQIYTNPMVIELETLGPVIDLAPGEWTSHREIWMVYKQGEWPSEIVEYFNQIRMK
jgi:hypothetical protein